MAFVKAQSESNDEESFQNQSDHNREDVEPSATIRFYAIRDHYRIVEINQMNLENFVQPILVECVGC